MQSTARKLEQRVTVLEEELRKVRSELKAVRRASKQPWWTRVAGRFKNDALFDEIIKAGNAYRRSLIREFENLTAETPRARRKDYPLRTLCLRGERKIRGI